MYSNPWDAHSADSLLPLLRALTEAPQTAARIEEMSLTLAGQQTVCDWADPPLRAASLVALRALCLRCVLSKRALASILGAAGGGLQSLDVEGTTTGLHLLSLLGAGDDAPDPPYAWMEELEHLKLHTTIAKETLRPADRALGRLPALQTLKVA
jgi:hypothetical protein